MTRAMGVFFVLALTMAAVFGGIIGSKLVEYGRQQPCCHPASTCECPGLCCLGCKCGIDNCPRLPSPDIYAGFKPFPGVLGLPPISPTIPGRREKPGSTWQWQMNQKGELLYRLLSKRTGDLGEVLP
jgi:hypothetical protein